MSSEAMNNDTGVDDLRREYDFSEATPNVYAQRYGRAAYVAVIDDDLRKDFPNTEAVNNALRELLRRRKDGAA